MKLATTRQAVLIGGRGKTEVLVLMKALGYFEAPFGGNDNHVDVDAPILTDANVRPECVWQRLPNATIVELHDDAVYAYTK